MKHVLDISQHQNTESMRTNNGHDRKAALHRQLGILEQVVNGATYREVSETYGFCQVRARSLVREAVIKIRKSQGIKFSNAYELGVFSARELRGNKDYWLGSIQSIREHWPMPLYLCDTPLSSA